MFRVHKTCIYIRARTTAAELYNAAELRLSTLPFSRRAVVCHPCSFNRGICPVAPSRRFARRHGVKTGEKKKIIHITKILRSDVAINYWKWSVLLTSFDSTRVVWEMYSRPSLRARLKIYRITIQSVSLIQLRLVPRPSHGSHQFIVTVRKFNQYLFRIPGKGDTVPPEEIHPLQRSNQSNDTYLDDFCCCFFFWSSTQTYYRLYYRHQILSGLRRQNFFPLFYIKNTVHIIVCTHPSTKIQNILSFNVYF